MPIWLIVLIIAAALLVFIGFVPKVSKRPPSGQKGRQLPPDDHAGYDALLQRKRAPRTKPTRKV